MLTFNNLLENSQKRFESIDLETIHNLGIQKQRHMFASSTIQVAYPPLDTLRLIHEKITPLKSKKKIISLYVHIPFCSGTCSYCGFIRKPVLQSREKANEVFDEYLGLINRELCLLLNPKVSSISEQEVASLYIGGGTPATLGPERLSNLLMSLRKRLNIPQWAEITVEGSPETLSTEIIQALVESGCTRLSIGVQSFDDTILRQIGRKHTGMEAEVAVEKAREVNMTNINIDLIRNLPWQDTKLLFNDLCHIREISPPSVTNYHLTIKPNTRMALLYKRHPELFPDERTMLKHHLFLLEGMTALGYTQDPVDWFLYDKQLHQCIHQKLKWVNDTDLIGVGCSAYSFCNNVQYYNYRSLADYGRTVQNGKLPIAAASILDELEQFHRRVVFGLRYEIDCQQLLVKTGLSVENIFGEQIERLGKAGLVSLQDNILSLTSVGRLFADEIMGEFYSQKAKSQVAACVCEH